MCKIKSYQLPCDCMMWLFFSLTLKSLRQRGFIIFVEEIKRERELGERHNVARDDKVQFLWKLKNILRENDHFLYIE